MPINAKGHPYNVVPPRLDPDARIEWTPVWSLTQRRHRYLPTSMLYSMPAEARGPQDLIADSNGCAAGNTLAEAILQGFYELAERDAFAIWWYNRLRVPAVDLSSFDDAYLASAPDYYAGRERDLWVLDVTSEHRRSHVRRALAPAVRSDGGHHLRRRRARRPPDRGAPGDLRTEPVPYLASGPREALAAGPQLTIRWRFGGGRPRDSPIVPGWRRPRASRPRRPPGIR